MRKDGGTIRRARRVPLTCALGLAGALGLAACSGDDEIAVADPNTPTGCPDVRIAQDLAQVTQFREGAGRDLTDVVSHARIVDFSGQCEYQEGDVTVDLDLAIGAERGPASTTGSVPLTYFVAVVDPQNNVLNKAVFETEVTFDGTATRNGTLEELTQIIPLKQQGDGAFYTVLVGFQLTPDQLEFNRR